VVQIHSGLLDQPPATAVPLEPTASPASSASQAIGTISSIQSVGRRPIERSERAIRSGVD
jgi:hypothetical protein